MTTQLTEAQIRASLEAQGISGNKQDRIVADLLTVQSLPPVQPPVSQTELRQILRFITEKSIEQWPSWAIREPIVRSQFSSLFAALDARDAAAQILALEVGYLKVTLGE